MRASRLVTATIALAGITMLAASPACSSSSNSSFLPPDGSTDALVPVGDTGTGPDGQKGDGGKQKDAHVKDAPTSLGMPDTGRHEASTTTEAGFSDARPDVGFDATACDPDASAKPGPLKHICIIYPTAGDDGDECDGFHDPPAPYPPNGATGNGFDDNCNGLVDEGCACDMPGTTKTCYLVPATQTENGVPVGWCAENSKGTLACVQQGESTAMWSGVCRGAQPPYASDVCAPGDFNCDGAQENSTTDNCSCASGVVTCPTDPVITVPYPDPNNLPLKVDATSWFVNPAQAPMATDWQWTLTGGDCDNILPHPSFGIYASSSGNGNPLGTQSNSLGTPPDQHGIIASAPAVTSSVYPAFSLSGDYLLQAQWMLAGKQYQCSVKVEVRAPGIRAEGCWATEGDDDDLDLHMAKINDFPQCATSHGWSDLPAACTTADEDCYYGNCYTADGDAVDWGYAQSPASSCNGWGSQSGGGSTCNNPRLDRDANGESGTCDPTVTNPNDQGLGANGPYCGPENINVDHPNDNDRFAVGLRFYRQGASPSQVASSHVNVYCDGARVLSAGYDPTVMGAVYPELLTAGADSEGDMWKVAILTTTVTGAGLTCNVVPTQSQVPNLPRDGSNAYCVDDYDASDLGCTQNCEVPGQSANSQILLTSSGLEPANANSLCYH